MLTQVEGPCNRKGWISSKNTGPERIDSIRMWARARLKKNLEVAEQSMEVASQRNGITRPVNIGTFDQVYNPMVKHIQDRKCRLLRGALE